MNIRTRLLLPVLAASVAAAPASDGKRTSATVGQHPFLCTFPGHFAIMTGKLVVN